MDTDNKITELALNFSDCTKLMTALGDETRQHIILEMLKLKDCQGVRVGAITEKANLSRPAVSHHLQILKNAGILKVRKEATKNYYYFDPEMESFEKLINTLKLAIELSAAMPDRSENI